jgi:hypothetical protein
MEHSSILENIIINKKMMLLNRKNFIPSTSNTTIETGSGAYNDSNGNKYIRKRMDSVFTKKKGTSTQCFGMSSNFTIGNIKTTSLANRFHIHKIHTDNGNIQKGDNEYYDENSNKTRKEYKSNIFNNKVRVYCENFERNQKEPCFLNKKSNILVKPNIFSKLNNNINKIKNSEKDDCEHDDIEIKVYKDKKSTCQKSNNEILFNNRKSNYHTSDNRRCEGEMCEDQNSENERCLNESGNLQRTGEKEHFIQQFKNSPNINNSIGNNMNINTPLFILKNHTSNFIKDNHECPVIYDPDLFENEINKTQLNKFTQIYCYKDIKFYFNLYQEYRKSKVVEIISYWMGILDGPINSEYDEFDIARLLDNDIFIHNLKFCLILFVYNSNIEALVRQKINFPLLVYNLKKFSYFTNDTDLLFDWNEKLELFTVGYDFDVVHFIESVPKYFLKNWILFENDFPLNLSDFCVEKYGSNWTEVICKKYNVQVKFLNNETMEQRRNAYETLFKLYKQCIFYISYTQDNIEKNKSNWYNECFLNGTPILTTDENEFGIYDYYDNTYNLVFIDEITWNFTNYTNYTYSEYIRNLFNTKNIQKMSSLIYKMRTNLIDHKVNIVDYFKFIHFTIFKLNKVKNNNNVLNELIVL